MRIPCPYCGERDVSEFSCLGEDRFRRPDPNAPEAERQFVQALYLRDNVAGEHEELWYHGSGCRSWLRVRRDTRTHEVISVVFANGARA